MTQELFIKRYKANSLGHLILPLSLDGFQKILPHVFLELDDPRALQHACFEATRGVPDAYYDTDAIGWHCFPERIGDNFVSRTIYDIPQPDRNRVLHWLENGDSGGYHTFPHRGYWDSACTWAIVYDEINEYFSGNDLNLMKGFAHGVRAERKKETYSKIKEDIASEPESYFDTWQKTRFHIYIIPDVLISHTFIPFNRMREAHIIKNHTDAYLAQGGDPEILERMVIKYAELHEGNEWTQKYVDDKEAFKIKNLWSDRFLEKAS